MIGEIEVCGWDCTIKRKTHDVSSGHFTALVAGGKPRNVYEILINQIADKAYAKTKYNTDESSDEISLSHELGHLHFEILVDTNRFDLDTNRPPNVERQKYYEVQGEIFARKTENLIRTGIKARLLDP